MAGPISMRREVTQRVAILEIGRKSECLEAKSAQDVSYGISAATFGSVLVRKIRSLG
jgi:hypothetical protein